MSTISVKTGSEGPRHDPYGYTEYHVTRSDGTEVILHAGLANWCDVRMPNGMQDATDEEKKALAMFECYAGVSFHTAIRAVQEKAARRLRYHPCGDRHLKEVAGYPGEHFLICDKCGDIVDGYFCEGEVI